MDDFLEQLKMKTSLIGLIGRDMKLTRKGRDALGLCPFHHEKTPSFNVVEDKQFYHCFGCGKHGDAISWLMERQNLEFKDAVQILADDASMTIPDSFFGSNVRQAESKDYYHVMVLVADYFHQKLMQGAQGKTARDYLQKRGVDDSLIKQFHLGYAPDNQGFHEFLQYMHARDVTDEQLEKVGVIAYGDDEQGNNEKRPYARFRHRLIFPIKDARSRVIAFGGRSLRESDKAKYINSPETILFHKGAELYHYDQAMQATKKGEYLIVAEGYMDVLRLVGKGFKGAVAPLGTALTEQQLIQLWRLASEPILCFDGDKAGKAAGLRVALRALPLLQPGKSLLCCFMPEGHDPDSFLQDYGSVEFDNQLQQAMPLGKMLFHHTIQEFTLRTPETRAGLEQQLMDYANRIKNDTLSKHYRNFFKQMIWESLRGKKQNHFASMIMPNKNESLSPEYRLYQTLALMFLYHPELYVAYEEKMAHYATLAKADDLFAELRFYLNDDEAENPETKILAQQEMPLLFNLYHHHEQAVAIDAQKANHQMVMHYFDALDYQLLKSELKQSKLPAVKRAMLREQLELVEQKIFDRQIEDK